MRLVSIFTSSISLSLLVCAALLSGCVSHRATPASAQVAPQEVHGTAGLADLPAETSLTAELQNYYALARSGGDQSVALAASVQSLAKLIEGKGADVNQANSAGVVPLALAAAANDAVMIERLTKAGANPNALSAHQIPLLTLALQEGALEAAKALVNGGANPNTAANNSPNPLTVAVLGGITSRDYREMSLFLLDHGANANYGSIGEHTLLLYAIKTAQQDLALKLVERGANLELTDEEKMTPLSWAVALRQDAVVDAMLAKNARGDTPDANGYTPFAWAVLTDNQTAIVAIAKAGYAQSNTDRGFLAAQIAKTRTLPELLALLGTQADEPKSLHNIVRFKNMEFITLEYSGQSVAVKTKDPLIKDFLLDTPDRLVLDFSRNTSVANVSLPLEANGVFQKVSIGRHAGSYRVVILLNKAYKYTLTKTADGYLVTLR
ncbi:hypothetical protein FACS1894103_3680 [Campylobacterota bacterium]|nr:hypothetical protein FACS1894103_3680 [Campylobacterota bacterium]